MRPEPSVVGDREYGGAFPIIPYFPVIIEFFHLELEALDQPEKIAREILGLFSDKCQ